ncbi:MAG: M23 family metallopeptidase [Neisseria sp.]|nr:M23 family metallopeptidase [Neisseria sp.]
MLEFEILKTVFGHMTRMKQTVKRLPVRKRLVLVSAFSLCAVAAYAVSEQAENMSDYRVEKILEELPEITLRQVGQKGGYWTEETVAEGETMHQALRRLGIPDGEIGEILGKSSIDGKLRVLHRVQMFGVRRDSAGQATDIQFFHDDDYGEYSLIALEKINGRWQASESEISVETMPTLRSVVVKTSVSGSLEQAGVNVGLREALRGIFRSRFDTDSLKTGDQIRLLYDTLYFRGQEVAAGDILAAEIVKGGKTYQAYYYDGGGGGSYYDENGKAWKAATGFHFRPVKSARISSPYGMRVHPILNTVKMHTGIDYAAPAGTPVYAPADGTMVFKGWKGGYGYTVVLQHGNGVETLYAHLSGFSPAQGKVKAGEVIGFVGSSGRSTGAHLHYEVRINGNPVNPATVALPAPKMQVDNMAKFHSRKNHADGLMAAVRDLPVTVARLY